MASPTIEEFKELEERVDRLTRLVTAQATYMRELLAFGAPPVANEPDEKLYSIAEATELLGFKRTLFGALRKELKVKPVGMVGKSPRFTRGQIETVRDYYYND